MALAIRPRMKHLWSRPALPDAEHRGREWEPVRVPIDNSNAALETDWADQPLAQIVEHILRRYHEPLHRELAGLVARARLVEDETRGQPLASVGLAEHLEQIRLGIEGHLGKEENILFPLIVAGRGSRALMPVKVMMAEHDDHRANLARLRALAHDFEVSPHASLLWRALYRELRDLEADLNAHIDLENNVLFPRALNGGEDF